MARTPQFDKLYRKTNNIYSFGDIGNTIVSLAAHFFLMMFLTAEELC